MADMADYDDVVVAREEIHAVLAADANVRVIPIAYVIAARRSDYL